MRWLESSTDSKDTNLSKLRETVAGRGAWHAAAHGVARAGHDLVTEQQQENISVKLESFKTHRQDSRV